MELLIVARTLSDSADSLDVIDPTKSLVDFVPHFIHLPVGSLHYTQQRVLLTTTSHKETTMPDAVLSTPAQINAYRAIMLLRGLEFEIRNPGMRLTAKTHKCYTIIKRELGFRGNKMRVYAQYACYLHDAGIITLHPNRRAALGGLA